MFENITELGKKRVNDKIRKERILLLDTLEKFKGDYIITGNFLLNYIYNDKNEIINNYPIILSQSYIDLINLFIENTTINYIVEKNNQIYKLYHESFLLCYIINTNTDNIKIDKMTLYNKYNVNVISKIGIIEMIYFEKQNFIENPIYTNTEVINIDYDKNRINITLPINHHWDKIKHLLTNTILVGDIANNIILDKKINNVFKISVYAKYLEIEKIITHLYKIYDNLVIKKHNVISPSGMNYSTKYICYSNNRVVLEMVDILEYELCGYNKINGFLVADINTCIRYISNEIWTLEYFKHPALNYKKYIYNNLIEKKNNYDDIMGTYYPSLRIRYKL